MGVKTGSKVLHKVTGLSYADCAAISRGIAAERKIDKPRVVADCNNIVFAFSKSSNSTHSVANHQMKWASTGIVMAPVLDGKVRPICKQATNERIAIREKTRIKAFNLRKDIRKAKERLLNDKLDQAERDTIQTNIIKMERSCKAQETQATNKLPANFAAELKEELINSAAHSVNIATGGFVEDVIEAEFQADCYIAGQVINNKAVMAMTADADIPILCGDCCIAIKGFTGKSFEIVCVSESMLKKAMEHLPSDSKAQFISAEFPIFDGVTNPQLRALLMIVLGCDVWSGMTGVLASSLHKMLTSWNAKSEDELISKLRGTLKYNSKLTDEVIDTYISALIYEPTNAAPQANQTDHTERAYLFGPPTSLPKYLEEFAIDDNFIQNTQ